MPVTNQPLQNKRLSKLVAEFQPRQLIPSLMLGLIFGVMEITFAVSFAVLVFGNEMPDLVSRGIGLMLFSAVIFSSIIALFTSIPGVQGSIQDIPVAILSVVVAGIIVAMPAYASQDEAFVTVVAAIGISSLFTGLFFLTLGLLRSGGLVRFLPYPVIGGFLAGSGWLLATGSISVMAGQSLAVSEIGNLFALNSITMWLPGLLFAVALLVVMNRYKNRLIMPAMILGGVSLFYLIIWISNSSVTEAINNGWLVGPFSGEALFQPLAPSDISDVYWPAIFGQAGNFATIMVVSAMAILLNASGIELIYRKDMELNRELLTAGFANLASGLSGGMVGFHILGHSALSYKSGVSSRLTGLITAVICALAIIAGASVLSLFPRFILGGLLLYLGLTFLIEWVYEAWFKLPKADYLVVILILLVISAIGFLEGVAVGLIVTIILFVLNYSRTNVIKHTLTRTTLKSRVTRDNHQQQLLRQLGEEVYILQLQGFIFFGTANTLLEKVRSRIHNSEQCKLRFLLLDFQQVTGLDTTAMLSFIKMGQLTEAEDVRLILSNLSAATRQQFRTEVFEHTDGSLVRYFRDMDHALEWCEDQILESIRSDSDSDSMTIADYLKRLLPNSPDLKTLQSYLESMHLETGEYLIRQGDLPEDLYFLEEGQVTARLEFPDRDPLRLETMRGGQVLGEIGFYLGTERTASVIADQPSKLYRLTKAKLQLMEEADPSAALVLQELIIRLLAERTSHLIDSVNALQR